MFLSSGEPSNDRPVSLTSHLLKTMETIVLDYLHTQVDSNPEALQTTHQPGISVDEVVIYLLHRVLGPLEGLGESCS